MRNSRHREARTGTVGEITEVEIATAVAVIHGASQKATDEPVGTGAQNSDAAWHGAAPVADACSLTKQEIDARDNILVQQVFEYYRKQRDAGTYQGKTLEAIVELLQTLPDEKVRKARWKIARLLLTSCCYGRKTTAAAMTLLGADGSKLVVSVELWLQKWNAEAAADEAFWREAFLPSHSNRLSRNRSNGPRGDDQT